MASLTPQSQQSSANRVHRAADVDMVMLPSSLMWYSVCVNVGVYNFKAIARSRQKGGTAWDAGAISLNDYGEGRRWDRGGADQARRLRQLELHRPPVTGECVGTLREGTSVAKGVGH